MSDLVVRNGNETSIERLLSPQEVLQKTDDRGRQYDEHSYASNTKRAYNSDWEHFVTWCEVFQLNPLPASQETIRRYLIYYAEDLKVSTLQRRISAISTKHQEAGHKGISTREGELHKTWRGIRRKVGTSQRGKEPVEIDHIRKMVEVIPDSTIGTRDRALLLMGFAGAFRRSELVGLNVEDIERTREGLIIHLRKSKTDQEGKGREVAIPYGSNPRTCPIRALEDWLTVSNIGSGALFRAIDRHGRILEERTTKTGKTYSERLSDRAVALIVKRTAAAAGLNPELYAGHSLRAGFATSAANSGASYRAIKNQTGHRSNAMVDRYVRHATLFKENAVTSVGL